MAIVIKVEMERIFQVTKKVNSFRLDGKKLKNTVTKWVVRNYAVFIFLQCL